MPVNVKISSKLHPNAEPIRISITEPKDIIVKVAGPNTTVVEYKLNMRRALNGDIMIFDHKEVDIIVLLEKKKVVVFAKENISDSTYGAEKRLFAYLKNKGVVQFDSVEGGSVHGSLQGVLHESQEVDAVKMTLYEISKWLKTEEPFLDDDYSDMVDDYILHPDQEESTELGEVPHEEEKGSIKQHGLFAPYMYGRYTY